MENTGPNFFEAEYYAEPEIYDAPERLGFVLTPEQEEARELVVDAMAANSDEWREDFAAYALLTEEIIDGQESDRKFFFTRIGAEIHLALMRRDAGRFDDYLEDLELVADHVDGQLAVYPELQKLLDFLYRTIDGRI